MGTSLKNFWARAGDRLLAIAFPRTCVVTGAPLEEDDYENVAAAAVENVRFIGKDACPFCGAPYENPEKFCAWCRERPISEFADVPVRCAVLGTQEIVELVHVYKYKFVRGIARDMARMAERSDGYFDFLKNSILVPVPLWKKRFRWRGFNQSEFYAKELAKRVPGARVKDLLVRNRDTGTQTLLSGDERRKNIEGAFDVPAKITLDPAERYVVIDDVFTTGSTLGACVAALHEHGAKNIAVATFVRAIKHSCGI
ncbi:MAG: ComF family protein [Opitutales bacterium]|nr:ComF family protein [Opitutales bacterium]